VGREEGETMELVFEEDDIASILVQVFRKKGKLMVPDIREYMTLATEDDLAAMRPVVGQRPRPIPAA
jgi:hypothetical protein